MSKIIISGSGIFTPSESVSNDELADSFNRYVKQFNRCREKEIRSGEIKPLRESGADFIYDVSGIRSRYVLNKEGILDPGSTWMNRE